MAATLSRPQCVKYRSVHNRDLDLVSTAFVGTINRNYNMVFPHSRVASNWWLRLRLSGSIDTIKNGRWDHATCQNTRYQYIQRKWYLSAINVPSAYFIGRVVYALLYILITVYWRESWSLIRVSAPKPNSQFASLLGNIVPIVPVIPFKT